jgi:hypothetical protein
VSEPQARSREGWFRSRIVTRFAREPPLAWSLRARAALLTQEGVPPAPTGFRQTRTGQRLFARGFGSRMRCMKNHW